MKQVDFYLISNQVSDAKFKLASRLANKLQRMKQRALVITDDANATEQLDRVMWSFSDTSFLAHERIGDAAQDSLAEKLDTVKIGEHNLVSPAVLEQVHDVLINVSSDVPLFNHHFGRIAEIVECDDNAKAAARARYKRYQTEGFELKTHLIEL